MLKIIKTSFAYMAPTIMAAMVLNSCGEKTVIPNTTVYSFKHQIPESFRKTSDLSLEEFKPLMDGDIFFWGQAIRNINNVSDVEFDIGVQFHTKTVGRRIFIEKLVLETPNLKTERVINAFVDIDTLSKRNKLYYKRFSPFEKISGNSIPLTADFFTLRINYKIDDSPTKQMSIRFDNTTFEAPIL